MNEQQQQTIVDTCKKQVPKGYMISGLPTSEEIASLIRMTAQGIDAHLEAINFEEKPAEYGRRCFVFDSKSMGVLCRRLAESAITESDDDVSRETDESLFRDILDTLELDPDEML